MRVSTVDEMRNLDHRAITEHGIPGEFLMENAGEAVYFAILTEFGRGSLDPLERSGPGLEGLRFIVLCGGGHNGGDGFVVARKLRSVGAEVRVVILSDPSRYDEAPSLHLEMVRRMGIPVAVKPPLDEIAQALGWCHIVVDAMLGTGLSREVGGVYREVIEQVNAAPRPVVAVDIPSGVDGNTGQVLGVAVEADLTVTFGLPKRGNLLYPGYELGGDLYVTHISFPPELWDDPAISVATNEPVPLPARRPDGHKGSFGDALFIAGAAGYYGAPALAALAHLRAGGGYARLAAPRSVVPHLATIAPEVVFVPQPETAEGTLSADAMDRLLELAERLDFAVVGPGLSLHPETQELTRRLVAVLPGPVLVDGDGLTAVAADSSVLGQRPAGSTVLTPHPGEMARLTGRSTAEILADPIPVLQRTAGELGAIVVLKGAHSLIGTPDGRVFINGSGNSGMATAGSGDVLTGTISALLGLGLGLEAAVRTGVFLHGHAGDLAAEETGEDGVTARTIAGFLPAAMADYRERYEDITADSCGMVRLI